MKKNQDTIFALSTPSGRSATATIRISGPQSPIILKKLTNRKTAYFKSNKSTYTSIYNKNNNLVDKSIVVYYRKPKSYTGENLIEIHTHGNPTIVQNLIGVLLEKGVRLAKAGEFTKTAYINNKIDLIQAEAVYNLINSQTTKAINISLDNLEGKLSNEFLKIRKKLKTSLSLIEYELDISEVDTQTSTTKTVYKNIDETIKKINNLIKSHKTSDVFSSGARVVIVGKPNVGKSTLFNLLLNYERSIVTNVPGTTRDTVEAPITVGGFAVKLIDTAGIRNTEDPVEKIGVQKTKTELMLSNLTLLVLDEMPTKKQLLEAKKTPTIIILNKSDLLNKKEKLVAINNNKVSIVMSAKNKGGTKNLLKKIENKLNQETQNIDSFYITSIRQKEVLQKIKTILKKLLKSKTPELEIISINIKDAIGQFDWLLGRTTPDDILNNVFSNFCVGK
tara:strand:- start:5562 stop:6905 length:1344 start_codon:yes stop_codon:yes gene_type:complete